MRFDWVASWGASFLAMPGRSNGPAQRAEIKRAITAIGLNRVFVRGRLCEAAAIRFLLFEQSFYPNQESIARPAWSETRFARATSSRSQVIIKWRPHADPEIALL